MENEMIQGFRLSPQQRRLWDRQQRFGAAAFRVRCGFELSGALDVTALEAAVRQVVDRHEILRTSFVLPAGGRVPLQVIHPPNGLVLPEHDLSALPPEEQAREEGALLGALEEAPREDLPLGVALARLAPGRHRLLVTLPGLCADLVTLRSLMEDLAAAYAAPEEGPEEEPLQYADVAEWLNELTEAAEAPAEVSGPEAGDPFHPRRVAVPLDPETRQRLAAGLEGLTAGDLLLAAWRAVLLRHTGSAALTIGVSRDGRDHEDLARLPGLFAGYLPVRQEVDEERSFRAVLKEGRHARAAAGPTPRFLCEHHELPPGEEAAGLRFTLADPWVCLERFEARLSSFAGPAGLVCEIHFDPACLGAVVAARLAEELATLLRGALAAPDRPIGLLACAGPSAPERHALLREWNDTAVVFPGGPGTGFVHEIIADVASRLPERLALLCEGALLTYGELEGRAGRWAALLRERGAGPETVVAVLLERSLDLPVLLLGVLRAGAAWLPLDPGQPAERLAVTLEDSGACLVVTRAALAGRLPTWVPRILIDASVVPPRGLPARASGVTAETLAYLLYTSGSTGRPKGVMSTHGGLRNRLLWMQAAYGLGPEDRVLQKTPAGFDVSLWELLWPLMTGACLVLARPGGHQDPRYLAERIAGGRITTLHFVPSMLRVFLDEIPAPEAGGLRLPDLRRVIASGEALPADLRDRFLGRYGAALHNLYGPTEAAIDVTAWACRPGEDGVPIGRPIANTEVHVLDAELRPVRPGTPGELFLGGVGLARGYLGRPALTAERFVPDPWSGRPGARLYRTGDLGRHRQGGEIEFLGRLDHQVKIRGVRVEPAEVEAALLRHPGVSQAVAGVPQDGGEARLAAWIVPRPGAGELDLAALRAFLRERLPEPMIPSAWALVAALPYTVSGKLDRRALPTPEPLRASPPSGRAAPDDPLEQLLAGLWTDLLGGAEPGPDDDFFALGGHSLQVPQLLFRLRETLGVDLPLESFFAGSTLGRLAAAVRAARSETARLPERIGRAPRGEPLPLSFAQQRLWFLEQLEGPTAAYNIPLALRIDGPLDVPRLAAALGRVVARHEVLRTVFAVVDGQPRQVVLPPKRLELPVEETEGRPEGIEAAAAEEAGRPFDLAAGPLLRLRLLRATESRHVLLLTLHHIVADAWSLAVILDELKAWYGGGDAAALDDLPVQYGDFAWWQRAWIEGPALRRQLDAWRAALEGAPGLLELPADHPRPAVQSSRGAAARFALDEPLAARLRALGRERGATPYMTLLAGFALLLSRAGGQDDVVVGSPIANRNHRDIEPLVGFFVNTLALRVRLDGEPSFTELLRRVREVTLAAFAHQDLPFEKLVEELQPERHLSHNPLFQAAFVYQNVPMGRIELPGVSIEVVERDLPVTKFDLHLMMTEREDGLAGVLEYATDLFLPDTAARMTGHFQRLLAAAAAAPEAPVGGLPLLAAAERHEIVVGWNDTARPFPGLCLHQLVESQALLRPAAEAVRCHGTALTYAELDRRTDALAAALRRAGAGPGAFVGICTGRSLAMPLAVLAALKSGAAYVALDPAHPRERRAWLLAETGAALVLAEAALAPEIPAGIRVLCLEEGAEPGAALREPVPVTPADHAYAVTTSGSTGAPKIIVCHHRGAVSHLAFLAERHALGPDDTVVQLAPLPFDSSVRDLLGALAAGARVVIAPEPSDPEAVLDLIEEEQVTALLAVVPTLLAELCAAARGRRIRSVRLILASGEVLPPALGRVVREVFGPGVRLVNQYGPTECTLTTTFFVVPPDAPEDRPLPVGRPVGNARVYVLRDGLPVPAGVAGDVFLGGIGLAEGYLGRPDLTAEAFVPSPLPEAPGRLYRTGDRGRFRRDGVLEFLGRADRQVKIRGFRVEPGEVESALREIPEVLEAAVAARETAPGDRRLTAWVVGRGGTAPATPPLFEHLRSRLPAYLLPAWIVPLAGPLPRTPNGKVDLRRLPGPEPGADRGAEREGAPRSPAEELMLQLWAEVLGAPPAGIHQGFFEAGGHSLLATRLVARVRETFRTELPVRAVFEHPTVAELAAAATASGAEESGPPLAPIARDGLLPLSFAQQRLWFLDRLEGPSAAYNVPFAVRLRGPLDPRLLEEGLTRVTARHEALRTVIGAVDGEPHQVIRAAGPVPLPRVDLETLPVEERTRVADLLAAGEMERPFDLAAGPLCRALLVRLAADDHLLVLVVHHIATDAWSAELIREELALVHAGRPLPPLPLQYADWAVWQRAWLAGDRLAVQLAWWRQRLEGAPARLDLPTDRPRPAVQTFSGDVHAFTPALDLAALRAVGRAHGATLFMVLCAGLAVLLSRLSGQADLVVGTPIANRTRREVERLVGLFANTLALRVDLRGEPSFAGLLERVREVLLGAFAHQDLPFEKLVEELQPTRDLGHSPVFQTLFAFQPPAAGAAEIPGLEVEPLLRRSRTSRFELSLFVEEGTEGLSARFEFNTDLFDRATIARLASGFETLLHAAVAAPGLSVAGLPLLTAAERAWLLTELNQTGSPYPRELGVEALILEQARRWPSRPAVECAGRTLTYGELAGRVRRLARRLRRLGVRPGVPVGVHASRSVDLVGALLGVLAAGGAYVPLDPAFPSARLAFMLEDAAVPVVLCEPALRASLPASEAVVADLVAEGDEDEENEEELPFTREAGPDDLAYVLYTSGSTGRPKGVEVPRAALTNFLAAMADRFGVTAEDTFLAVTTISFDIAALELYVPLMTGARLVLAGAGTVRDGAALAALLQASGATLMQGTPSTWRLLLAAGWEPAPPLRLLCGGEALPADLARRLVSRGAPLWNLYGPTETTVWSALHRVAAADLEAPGPVAIGRPIANTSLHVLDRRLEPVPPGAAGELFIGGDGVARGYRGRPELTAERFLPDPFSPAPGARLYRTGDRVRRLADGRIEFLGRVDHQLKVRGFRIEPGDVEAALTALPEIGQALVVDRAGSAGDTVLAAYVVPAVAGAELPLARVREALRQSLPEYMLPTFLVPMAALPLTDNGKRDRRKLPDPASFRDPAEAELRAPRTPEEARVADLWRDLLGVETVGVEDDFFRLGGHSLLATRLVSRLRDAFGVELPVRAIFERPTVAGLAGRVRAALEEGGLPTEPVPRVPRDSPLPLSFAQSRLWFLERLEGAGSTYNVPVAVRLSGPFDPAALAAGLALAVERHEILRTVFREAGGEPVQVVLPALPGVLRVADLAALPASLRQPEAERLAADEVRRPFDLAAGPLLRCLLVRSAADDHTLVLTLHHIVSDAWSLGVLLGEIAHGYRARLGGVPPALPPLPVQYADFAVWQSARLAGEPLERELRFWRERLADAPRAVDLPTDRPRPPVKSFRGAVARFSLGADLRAGLEAAARAQGATLFMALCAGCLALLARLSGQDELVAGMPFANRRRAEIEPLVGFFVNTLVLRASLDGDPELAEVVRRVRTAVLEAHAHADLPFERLVEDLQPVRHLGRTPLFNVVLALQNAPQAEVELPGVAATLLPHDTGTAKFDLLFAFEPDEAGGLRGRIEHDTDLFAAGTVHRWIGHLLTLLQGAAADAHRRLSELPLLSEAERHLVVHGWNDTASVYPRDLPLHVLFAFQAARRPDAFAVRDGRETLSYGELARRSDRIARRLIRLGVRPGDCVALYLERSAGLIAALVGILAAGGAYVPLDPAYPAERLAFLVKDAGARVLITASDLEPRLPAHGLPVLRLDLDGDTLAAEPEGPPAVAVEAGDLAYVLYTSGSTGRPKGVAVPHRAVVRLVRGTDYVRLGPEHTVAQASNASFDAATFEIWGALLNGARLEIIATDTLLASHAFAARLAAGGLTTLWLTAGLFNQYSREVPDAFALLEHLLIGGEALDPGWVRRVLAHGAPRHLLNGYGPTEGTTFSATHRIDAVPPGETAIPIGRPIANTRAYVLDRAFQPQPLGVPGELCVGGDGLALGYLGRPELTAERFVPDPFAASAGDPGARLYRTGDLARWRGDGTLAFLGRTDQQVKLRGFRIEPGEIEAALGALPEVREAAVVLRENHAGDKHLVAYVVPAEGAAPSPADLRRRLAETLPEPLVPAVFAVIDALPLTPNGKVDRRSLPDPEAAVVPDAPPEPPRSALERRVAAVWRELLGTEPGRASDFFALGGHSLLAARLVARLREELALDVPVRVVFEQPALGELCAWIEEEVVPGLPEEEPLLAPVSRKGDLPLSFAQQRLWLLERLSAPGASYHVSGALRLRGDLEIAALAAALDLLVARHEALRTVFGERDGTPFQTVLPHRPPLCPVIDLEGLPGAEAEAPRLAGLLARARFDLAAGPVLRTGLVRLAPREHLLVLALHHIAVDGGSLDLLLDELARAYRAGVEGSPLDLPSLPVQPADFAVWQRQWLTGPRLDRQLAFWRQALEGAPPLLALPADRPRPAVQTFSGSVVLSTLEEDLLRRLESLGRGRDATLFMTLLAAFGVLLARSCGQSDIPVGAPVAHRSRRELQGVLGFFTNTLVLRVRLDGDPDFATVLDRVRETALDAFAHQDLPFEKLVEELQPRRDLSHAPLFQVMLAHRRLPAPPALAGLEAEPAAAPTRSAKLDLTLFVEETADGGAEARFEHNTDLFDTPTVQRLAGHFRALLAAIADDPAVPVSRLPLLTAAERHALLLDWNDTATGCAPDRPVHEEIAAWTERDPERVALVFRGSEITYGALDRRADRLAGRLRAAGVRPGDRVGLHLERSADLVTALLAVLKSGGAYIPLEPDTPPERLALMLEDAAPRVVLTRSAGEAELRIAVPPGPEMRSEGAGDLAYILYTSGSTGRPKGVEITHRALAHYVRWANRFYFPEPGGGDCALFTSLSFDFSVTPLFCPLTRGRRLTIHGPEEDLAAVLARTFAAASGVDTVKLTPSHVAFLEHVPTPGPSALRRVILGGEACAPAHVRTLRSRVPGVDIFNEYGPTEATVGCVVERLGEAAGAGERILIGRPIADMRAYVLDGAGQPVPTGVLGELYLAGEGLARGYWGRSDLTAERFCTSDLGRLYRTGDLARWRPDGRLELLGRRDGQVKIRGFRIELEEVETVLAGAPGVSAAAVALRERRMGEPELVAWVVTAVGAATREADLRSHLQARLPEPMRPSRIVFLDELPLAASGKVDRPRLPDPGERPEETGGTPPRTPREALLERLFAETLGRERVGVREDFFDLGGHSLLAVRLASRIHQETGRSLPLVELFRHPTVERLAAFLEEEGAEAAGPVVVLREGGPRPPLVLLPGAGGHVLYFRDLVRRLDDRTVLGLQAPGLDGLTPPLATLAELAACYLAALRPLHPGSAWRLAGHSFGGRVAYEMARQLRRAGERDVRVVILDTVAPDPRVVSPSLDWDDARWAEEILGVAEKLAGRSLGRPAGAFAGLSPAERIDALGRDLEDLGLLAPGAGALRVKGLLAVFEANHRIRYAPEPGGPDRPRLALVRAAQSGMSGVPPDLAADPALGWGPYACGDVAVRTVPGDHLTIFRAPHVDLLAEVLRRSLDEEEA